MYKKIKQKLKKLFNKETSAEKYQEILDKFKAKKKKLEDKDDKDSIEEIKIINKLMEKVEKKLKEES